MSTTSPGSSPLRFTERFEALTNPPEVKQEQTGKATWKERAVDWGKEVKREHEIKTLFANAEKMMSVQNLKTYSTQELNAISEDLERFSQLTPADPDTATLVREKKSWVDEQLHQINNARAEIAFEQPPEKRTINHLLLILAYLNPKKMNPTELHTIQTALSDKLWPSKESTPVRPMKELNQLFVMPNTSDVVQAKSQALNMLDISPKTLAAIPRAHKIKDIKTLETYFKQADLEIQAHNALNKPSEERTVHDLILILTHLDDDRINENGIKEELETHLSHLHQPIQTGMGKLPSMIDQLEKQISTAISPPTISSAKETSFSKLLNANKLFNTVFQQLGITIDDFMNIPSERCPPTLQQLQGLYNQKQSAEEQARELRGS